MTGAAQLCEPSRCAWIYPQAKLFKTKTIGDMRRDGRRPVAVGTALGIAADKMQRLIARKFRQQTKRRIGAERCKRLRFDLGRTGQAIRTVAGVQRGARVSEQ